MRFVLLFLSLECFAAAFGDGRDNALAAANAIERQTVVAIATLPEFSSSVAWYRFQSATWPQVDSSSVGTNSGAQTESAYRPSVSGGVATFDGDDFVTVDHAGLLNGATEVTWAAWVYASSTGGQRWWLHQASAAGAAIKGSLCLDGAAYNYVGMTSGGVGGFSYQAEQWIHVAVTWAQSDRMLPVYTNGAVAYGPAAKGPASGGIAVSGTPWTIGRISYQSSGYWSGKVAGFTMWSKRLTQSDIQAAMILDDPR